jgi:hypothetical protein
MSKTSQQQLYTEWALFALCKAPEAERFLAFRY